MAATTLLEHYRPIVGEHVVDAIYRLARPFKGKRVVHVNATREGGGVAEILHRLTLMMRELDIDVDWQVIDGSPEFFAVTKKFHNALHGVHLEITRADLDVFDRGQEANRKKLDLDDADFVIVHDPQPVGLVNGRKHGHWIWRCHVDIEHAHDVVWGHLETMVDRYDAVLFHLPQYAKPLRCQSFLVPPAIDALSDKNKPLDPQQVDAVLGRLGIPRDLPLVTQVSRFDRLKDPIGVLRAWRMVNARVPCRLVLVGGAAADDPEGAEVLAEVRQVANGNPRVHILDLPPDSHVEINAIQRAADVVIQKSLREGFGLVVTEAMWKGKATVGGDVGGIRHQIRHGLSGMLAQTIDGCALSVLELLARPALRDSLGRHARSSVLASYLLPSLLRQYLLVMRAVAGWQGV